MSVEDKEILDLQQRIEKIAVGGGEKAIEKQKAMGKKRFQRGKKFRAAMSGL